MASKSSGQRSSLLPLTHRAGRAVPATADIEAGYGETPDDMIESVAEIIRAGAVGVNLEDGTPHEATPIRNIPDAAAAFGRRARRPAPPSYQSSSMPAPNL